ncbi:RNA recognition motif domain-containing protein [Marinobacterium jannaschii]|uniref:RNA recognition motif domain-containing protein n=1 Tax=Marinobacterium jannaschii TaxID=64970 RepID=UPI00047FA033|nr:RNA-binding protein [Marinobacterium jannaschii]
MNIFVGNVSYRMQDQELEMLFAEFGEVQSAKIIMDRETGRSRGFAFVEMPDSSEALRAIESLNGQESGGRQLIVNQAKPRPQGGSRPQGGFRRRD